MLLKRRTPQNIVIGGAAGAIPPLVGWAAVTGGIALEPLIMFLIIFLWTPPHFWALAMLTRRTTRGPGCRCCPSSPRAHATAVQILVYTVLLAACTLVPVALGLLGVIYLVAAVVLGAPLRPARGAAAALVHAWLAAAHDLPLLAARTWRCCSPPWALDRAVAAM